MEFRTKLGILIGSVLEAGTIAAGTLVHYFANDPNAPGIAVGVYLWGSIVSACVGAGIANSKGGGEGAAAQRQAAGYQEIDARPARCCC